MAVPSLMSESGFAYIPVPANRLLEAYKRLADLGGADADAVQDGAWTAESIAELKRHVKNPAVRTMLDLTAKRAGQWVSIREVEKTAHASFATVRASLAGLTMMLNARFGDKGWPVEIHWTPHAEYRMSVDVAAWWLAGGR
jgi:hypothetical protein